MNTYIKNKTRVDKLLLDFSFTCVTIFQQCIEFISIPIVSKNLLVLFGLFYILINLKNLNYSNLFVVYAPE